MIGRQTATVGPAAQAIHGFAGCHRNRDYMLGSCGERNIQESCKAAAGSNLGPSPVLVGRQRLVRLKFEFGQIQSPDGLPLVGAGSAGCVVANRLSANPSCRVLLLEAGGSDRNFWLKLPVGYYRTIFNERFSRLFKTEPHETTGGRPIVWPRGRVLGGSSSINGLIFIRGQHEDFDDWDRLGASGWSYRELLPHFRRYERYSGGESQYHGGLGEFEVSNLRNNNAASAAWVEAGVESGSGCAAEACDPASAGISGAKSRSWSGSICSLLRP